MWICRKTLNVKYSNLFNLTTNKNVIVIDMFSRGVDVGGGGGSWV